MATFLLFLSLFPWFQQIEAIPCVSECTVKVLNPSYKKAVDCREVELDHINVSGCIPDEQVWSLDLSNHSIKELDGREISGQFPQINSLDLETNSFERLTNRTFRLMKSLEILNIRGNKINEVHKETFRDQTKLQTLDLSHNKLVIVISDWFNAMVTLQELHLNNNKIIEFLPDTFYWTPGLVRLTLGYNLITIIPPVNEEDQFSMDLEGNPLFCGCKSHNQGNFTNVTMQGGCHKFTHRLHMLSICSVPKIKIILKYVDRAHFVQCQWTGNPNPKVQLMSEDKLLAQNHLDNVISYGPVEENGIYVCKAENVMGVDSVNVTVDPKPLVTNPPIITTEASIEEKNESDWTTIIVLATTGSFIISYSVIALFKYKLYGYL